MCLITLLFNCFYYFNLTSNIEHISIALKDLILGIFNNAVMWFTFFALSVLRDIINSLRTKIPLVLEYKIRLHFMGSQYSENDMKYYIHVSRRDSRMQVMYRFKINGNMILARILNNYLGLKRIILVDDTDNINYVVDCDKEQLQAQKEISRSGIIVKLSRGEYSTSYITLIPVPNIGSLPSNIFEVRFKYEYLIEGNLKFIKHRIIDILKFLGFIRITIEYTTPSLYLKLE